MRERESVWGCVRVCMVEHESIAGVCVHGSRGGSQGMSKGTNVRCGLRPVCVWEYVQWVTMCPRQRGRRAYVTLCVEYLSGSLATSGGAGVTVTFCVSRHP